MDSTIRHRSSPSSHLERMKLRSIVVTNTVTPSLNAARTRHGLFPAHHNPTTTKRTRTSSHFAEIIHFGISSPLRLAPPITCLLYTSDAADDLLCVDLGGRRIIKKNK